MNQGVIISYLSKSIIFEKELLSDFGVNNINLIDVGSSFNLFEPFNYVEDSWGEDLKILCFEPNEETNITSSTATRINIDNALWSSEKKITFHIAKEKSKSSVHPPNIELIKKFSDENWIDRQTDKIIEIEAVTLDSVIKKHEFDADFIKIDTQGSEYEILEGAKKSISKGIFGALLETWSYPFHMDQKLTYDVMKIMDESGYFLADLNKGGYYRRKTVSNNTLFLGQIGQLDLLYFETIEKFTSNQKSDEEIIKAACLADLYGMTDYSIEILNYYKNYSLLIEKILSKRKTITNNVSNQWRIEKIKKLLNFKPRTPPLH